MGRGAPESPVDMAKGAALVAGTADAAALVGALVAGDAAGPGVGVTVGATSVDGPGVGVVAAANITSQGKCSILGRTMVEGGVTIIGEELVAGGGVLSGVEELGGGTGPIMIFVSGRELAAGAGDGLEKAPREADLEEAESGPVRTVPSTPNFNRSWRKVPSLPASCTWK